MPTSVHLPKPLLDAVDRKARALGLSRNRLVVRAIERELEVGLDWSPGFFDRLRPVDTATAAAVDDLLTAIRASRRSKAPRPL